MNVRSSFRSALTVVCAALVFASASAVAQVAYNTTPVPSVPAVGITIEAGAATLGNVSGTYTGGPGNIAGMSLGSSDLYSAITGGTNGCVSGCGNIQATFAGMVKQKTGIEGWVQGTGGNANMTTGTASRTLLDLLVRQP